MYVKCSELKPFHYSSHRERLHDWWWKQFHDFQPCERTKEVCVWTYPPSDSHEHFPHSDLHHILLCSFFCCFQFLCKRHSRTHNVAFKSVWVCRLEKKAIWNRSSVLSMLQKFGHVHYNFFLSSLFVLDCHMYSNPWQWLKPLVILNVTCIV